MIYRPSAEEVPESFWLKSSYSDSSNPNDCVEVAATPDTVLVRDSKNLQGPHLALAPAAWAGFVAYAARR
ncbi:DUF397 domain-containing protein [Streptomyces globisporus]|uniref:DUF397 domain-containing protein n=1 Tax=Streptomyces globisporus TaxID=1908 RepID=UPI0037AA77F1